MKRKFSTSLAFFCLVLLCSLIYACRKDPEPPRILSGYQIEVKSGDGQTDSIGNRLKKEVVFKVSKNDSATFTGFVQFEILDCDGLPIKTEQIIERRIYPEGYELLIPQWWKLNATVRTQTMKAVLLDSLRVPRDSVTVTATGIAPTKGWHTSGCLDDRNSANSFAELPSGRVLAALYNPGPPYYSDDDGVSWHALKTFPGGHKIKKIIATSSNEVFLSTEDQGIHFSPDGGQTWQLRNSGLPLNNYNGAFYYTKSGKLFVSTITGVYLSHDKGLNWHLAGNGLPFYASFWDASSLANGRIVALSSGTLMTSTDGGENWREVYTLSVTANPSCLFSDENNNVYIGLINGTAGTGPGLYRSDSTMQSWTKLYTVNPPPGFDQQLSQMSEQNGSYYFYASSKNILITTQNFVNYSTVAPDLPDNNGRFSYRYLVKRNNRIIVSTEFFGMYYNIP